MREILNQSSDDFSQDDTERLQKYAKELVGMVKALSVYAE